jgi:hypothetical protein
MLEEGSPPQTHYRFGKSPKPQEAVFWALLLVADKDGEVGIHIPGRSIPDAIDRLPRSSSVAPIERIQFPKSGRSVGDPLTSLPTWFANLFANLHQE